MLSGSWRCRGRGVPGRRGWLGGDAGGVEDLAVALLLLLVEGGVEVVFGEAIFDDVEGLLRGVGELEEVEVLEGDGALFGHGFEVDDGLPVVGAVDDDGDLLGELFGLREGEQLEHLVERAEAAGEDDQRLGEVGEPVLAHEEVVELEVELGRDPGVGTLFEGQLDVEADGLAAGLEGAAVGGLHDAGTSAGGDDEAVAAAGQRVGPLGDHAAELAGVLVVAGHLDGGEGAIALELCGLGHGASPVALSAAMTLAEGCSSAGASSSEPVFSSSFSSAVAASRPMKRAEPKKTTVSWMRSRRKRAVGSRYSLRMRTRRPSAELRNSGFS